MVNSGAYFCRGDRIEENSVHSLFKFKFIRTVQNKISIARS